MESFEGRIAVVTGGGSGMGRALVMHLAAAGASVAACDVRKEALEEMADQAREIASGLITTHLCDVSDEDQVIEFRDAVLDQHDTDHVHLLFNNAGIGGGGSFVSDPREQWERTFNVCWGGVYFCARAFLPALIAADEAHLVNTSSVNGFWASLGPNTPHTAYSAAKFAVKGFSEALITDLALNAPHVKVSVVMPGHIGTDIVANSRAVHGQSAPEDMTAEEIDQIRQDMTGRGLPVEGLDDDEIRNLVPMMSELFRDNAPMTAEQAAKVIIDAVRESRWRVLVGDDAVAIDEAVRSDPEHAYDSGGVGLGTIPTT